MAVTPDPTRDIGSSCCSKCGRLLLVNDQALIHEDMSDGTPLVIGNCCADRVIGAVMQDYADMIKRQIFMNYLIKPQSAKRLERVLAALTIISQEYQSVLEDNFSTVRASHETE